jgi:hypothetical protein
LTLLQPQTQIPTYATTVRNQDTSKLTAEAHEFNKQTHNKHKRNAPFAARSVTLSKNATPSNKRKRGSHNIRDQPKPKLEQLKLCLMQGLNKYSSPKTTSRTCYSTSQMKNTPL